MSHNTTLRDVIDRALVDANYAEELKNKAMLVLRNGKHSDDWKEFMKYFAKDSRQLMEFTTFSGDDDNGCTATTALTTTVTSTVICTLTTTTLTTSIFCG